MLVYLFSVVLNVDCWVDWELFLVRSWCPRVVGIEFGRNLAMLLSVKKGHVERFFFLMELRSVVFLDFPCFYARSLGYHSLFPLVWSHWSVMLPVVLLVGWFHLVETSTFWWLVPCSLLILFSRICVPAQSVFLNVTVHMLSHSTGMDMRGSWMPLNLYAISDCSGSPSIFILHCMCALIFFHLVAGPLLVLFVCRSCLEYSYTNSLRWPHYSLLDLNF